MATIEQLKKELENKIFDQGVHWKILFIGTSVNGTTDIVASLSRSLRNLGHHVLDLDTSRHRVLNNPLRRQGGMGPIYVDYEKISPILDKFNPQIIICCAGGLTFTEEDAERLKSRGFILVGITLSDPDVFPSIKNYQHVFDIHTTNAEIALKMYEDEGVRNTVYFPFGIDRGFVTQNVPETDAFDADVICLGHATNRPDRNSVMTYLDKKFDVKTYGRGWDIPNSTTVAGQEMVQALQGGKVHVNFPLTRAGFINIKCGVFESAGQGKVVATGEFDEMSQFFTYGEDIIGYRDETDLEVKIQHLLDNPEEYDRVATNGFKRIISEHLYEHRWMSLFQEILEINAKNNRWLSVERAAKIESVLSNTLPRAKKVIISGFYGARNLGDEMILQSISQSLQNADESVQVYVASENPTSVERDHGLQAFERKSHEVSSYQVKTAAAVVLGGGGLWHDYTFERGGGLAAMFTGGRISMAGFGILPLMAKTVGAEFHVVGLGVGPLSDKYAIDTVRFLSSQADSIYVRDLESKALLENTVGINDPEVVAGPDTVYAAKLPKNHGTHQVLSKYRELGHVVVGLNLRPWGQGNMEVLTRNVRSALASLENEVRASGRELVVVALPMQAGKQVDRAAIHSALETISETITVIDLNIDGELSIESYVEALNGCDAVLAMRLHASLIAHRVGIPAVGLCYDPKVRRHFEEVLRPECGLQISATPKEIFHALSKSIRNGMSAESHQEIRKLESQASTALNRSIASIRKISDTPRVYSVPSETEAGVKKRNTSESVIRNAMFQSIQTDILGFVAATDQQVAGISTGLVQLKLSMPVEVPLNGMGVTHRGILRISENHPTDVIFKVTSPYSNARAAGSIFIEFSVDGYKFRQDLAESPAPVEIVFSPRSQSKFDFDFEFKIICEKDSFKARSWASATNVTLDIQKTRRSSKNRLGVMTASSGTITSD